MPPVAPWLHPSGPVIYGQPYDPGSTGAPPNAAVPRRYPQLNGAAGTPGGQPIDFGAALGPASTPSGGGSSGGADPTQTVAQAFLAALGSAGQGVTGGAVPTVLYPSVDTTGDNSGGSVNVKSIAILAVIVVAAWFAWKKWGKPAAA